MTSTRQPGLAYADHAYVNSLAEFGTPCPLPLSGGWLLEQPISGTTYRDLTGPYPLFSCRNWSRLGDDLANTSSSQVSVALVADPLADTRESELRQIFPDHISAFKPHLVRDMSKAAPLPSHHRRHLRRAARWVDVEVCANPVDRLDDWTTLYSGLVAQHSLVGVRAFSKSAFHQQLAMPGMVAVRGEFAGETISMALWLTDGHKAYYHLGASSAMGRRMSASYAVFSVALDHLRGRGVQVINFGGAAGPVANNDGLFRFKGGWANGQRMAYLCGRVLKPHIYARLQSGARSGQGWFPAYRAPKPVINDRTPGVEREPG